MSLPLAILLVALGGILLGTFSLPVTRTPNWKFEHIWFVGSLLALLVIPWPLVFGAMLEKIPTDCPHTSSCCLGPGAALFITTSRLGLDEPSLAAAPLSGTLLTHSP